MSSKPFNSLLLEISNQLTAAQLEDLKFLCRDLIGKRDLEKISSGTKLFDALTQRRQLGADNTDYLSGLLSDIKRQDLSDKLNGSSTDNQPDEAEKDNLDLATDVLAENLVKNWRKLGYKLGLSDVKLESISRRHPTELEERTRELMKEWRKSRGGEAQTEELIKALRACQLILIAEKVEDRLPTP